MRVWFLSGLNFVVDLSRVLRDSEHSKSSFYGIQVRHFDQSISVFCQSPTDVEPHGVEVVTFLQMLDMSLKGPVTDLEVSLECFCAQIGIAPAYGKAGDVRLDGLGDRF